MACDFGPYCGQGDSRQVRDFAMAIKPLSATVASVVAILVSAQAHAQKSKLPDLSGSYRCEPEPRSCEWSGSTFTVTQAGAVLHLKNEKGDIGEATMSSPITLSVGAPWNMIGEVLPDHRTIQWSNGTDWRKQ
jgi:hypothetical protein